MNENYQFLVYIFASIGFIGTSLTKQKYYGYGLDAFLGAMCLAIAIAFQQTETNLQSH
jgi:small-conductance mechanosensitive channel